MSASLDTPVPYELRRLAPGDGKALAAFYRGLSSESRRKLTPLGLTINRTACELICFDNFLGNPDKYDLVLLLDGRIVGWCFLWGIRGPHPSLGLAIADAHQGKHLGRGMLAALLDWVRAQRNVSAIHLTVEQDNMPARRLYEAFGFSLGLAAGPQPQPGCCEMILRLTD